VNERTRGVLFALAYLVGLLLLLGAAYLYLSGTT
jgi:hypothetical protein